jgi:hypothetical protein
LINATTRKLEESKIFVESWNFIIFSSSFGINFFLVSSFKQNGSTKYGFDHLQAIRSGLQGNWRSYRWGKLVHV